MQFDMEILKEIEKANPGLSVRYTKLCDLSYHKEWLSDPTVNSAFPVMTPAEIDDSARRWNEFYKCRSSLTATIDGNPCGVATLYLHPYKKIQHHSELGIILDKKCRGKGVGFYLMCHLMILAKNMFGMELVHLQVYEGNPAYLFYKKLGFVEFGKQKLFIKEAHGGYSGRVFMERYLDDIPKMTLTYE